MSGIEIIAAALAAGALAGTTGVATDAVRDAYAALRRLLISRFADRPAVQQALEDPDPDSDRWVGLVCAELSEVGADRDEKVLAAARAVLDSADTSTQGKYRPVVFNNKGVVVGDGNTVPMTFNH